MGIIMHAANILPYLYIKYQSANAIRMPACSGHNPTTKIIPGTLIIIPGLQQRINLYKYISNR